MGLKLSETSIRLLGLCVFYLMYLFLGAAIFSAIEFSNERRLIDTLKSKRQEFLQKHKACITDAELEAFIKQIVDANNRGISAMTNLTVEPNWSFGQAVFFSGTVLTTIGYGHVSPLSSSGKVFCILYAILGIPMTLVMISACVERLLIVTNGLYDRMKRSGMFVSRITGMVNLQLLTYSHLGLVFLFVLAAFFLLPAAVFSWMEKDWNYLDAIYYCFISLSTIGLGDYIPGDNNEQPYRVIYKIATTFYLIIGIMFVMLLISVITQIPQLNLAKLFSLERDTSTSSSSDAERQYLAEGMSHSASYSRQIDEEDPPVPASTSLPADDRSSPKF